MRHIIILAALISLATPSYAGFKIGGSVGKVIGKVTNPIRDHITKPLGDGVKRAIKDLSRRISPGSNRPRPSHLPTSSRLQDPKYNNPTFCSSFSLTRHECLEENQYALGAQIINGYDYDFLVHHNRVVMWSSRGDIKGWCACEN